MPVYLVKSPAGDRLVDAPNKTAAVKFVVGDTVTAEAVTTSEMAALLKGGMQLESAELPTVETAEQEETDGEG